MKKRRGSGIVTFDRCLPEDTGVQSAGILRFVEDMRAKGHHLHALMVLRHGKIIAEGHFAPWDDEHLHMLYSLSKSFTSTAVGFAVQDGLLSVTDRLVDFFPEHLPARPCENMQKIEVRHLLTMNTGHAVEPAMAGDCWEKTFLQSYVEHEPGTHFLYNTAATYMLACIVQKVTGKKLIDYLREKLFAPLGMREDIWFEESPTGVATGGFGLNVSVLDIAKLGQFYLQKGVWDGKQLLNADWIAAAQTPWSDNSSNDPSVPDWRQGYGYQFWMCRPEGVFRGDGAFGQYCIVLPRQDMVIAINSGVTDMQAVMQSIWDNVLPGVGEEALEPGAEAEALTEALRAPVIPAEWEEQGLNVQHLALEENWIGKYDLPENEYGLESIEVSSNGLGFTVHGAEARIPLSRDSWKPCEISGADGRDHSFHRGFYAHCAVRAARQDNALRLHMMNVETPFETFARLEFVPHGVRVHLHRNVGFANHVVTVYGIKR